VEDEMLKKTVAFGVLIAMGVVVTFLASGGAFAYIG
jgi:hypothetical protein